MVAHAELRRPIVSRDALRYVALTYCSFEVFVVSVRCYPRRRWEKQPAGWYENKRCLELWA